MFEEVEAPQRIVHDVLHDLVECLVEAKLDRSEPMVITLPPHLESALAARAQQRGVPPEALALDVAELESPLQL